MLSSNQTRVKVRESKLLDKANKFSQRRNIARSYMIRTSTSNEPSSVVENGHTQRELPLSKKIYCLAFVRALFQLSSKTKQNKTS